MAKMMNLLRNQNCFKNMQLIVIHKKEPNGTQRSIFHTALSSEPMAAITLSRLMNVHSFDSDRKRTSITIPEDYQVKSSQTKTGTNYYTQNIPVCFDRKSKTRQNQWFVIINGRFVTDIDKQWLFSILEDFDAHAIAVNVDPELANFREKIRITSQGHIAGFRRLYSDTAQEVPVPNDWPQQLFVNINILSELLLDDALPLTFQEFLSRCAAKSLNLRSINIAGEVLDLETEDGFLAFIDNYLNTAWPENSRKYMRLLNVDNAAIDESARLFGKVFLGHNVRICQNAIIIGPAIIADNVKISNEVLVKSSVIASNITVPEKYCVKHRFITNNTQLNGEYPSGPQGNGSPRRSVISKPFGHKNRNNTFRTWPRFSYTGCCKRFFDMFTASILLILFAPVIPFLALAVKLSSPGSVFFKDKRQGLHGKEFKCLKFRTMATGADRIQSKLRVISHTDGPQFKVKDDPRITTVGRFLRDTCLDEIPQFFNVLLGQMSLIGPRPSPASENSLCPPWRDARLSVRPGITGLWQICRTRRQGQDFQEWIHYDIKYVRDISFKLDMWIFAQTVKKLVKDFVSQF
jgi:lipopolysaccharide/colanic/teichoic acid biosynthesis glycosyltransferase/NDP-sugar pyrophosphorylase family protein